MMIVAEAGRRGQSTSDMLAPLFGEAWSKRPLDLLSGSIKGLAATGMLNPRGLKSSEVRALASAVMASIVAQEK